MFPLNDMNKKEIIIISSIATLVIVLLILLLTNTDKLSFYQIGDYVNKGNNFFDDEKYDEATVKYVGALGIDSTHSGALYNNANAAYRNGQYESANKSYEKAIRSTLRSDATEETKELASSMYHNRGNSYMKKTTPLDSVLMTNEEIQKAEAAGQDASQIKQAFYQKAQEDLKAVQNSIKNYKESLRQRPENDSTRFNLALAQDYQAKVAEILQNMTPPSNQNSNNDQNDKKDDNKDQQDQQQQEDKQDQKDQNQDQQQDQNQMSKENAEQILKALEQEEKEQQKKRKVEQKDSRYKTDKDW